MKIIPRSVHGILDYVVGIILILSPRLFGFNTGGAEETVPVTLGCAALVYSLLTNYELGLLKWIPFRVHLMLDFASGVFLAASPWLLGFADRIWMPHLILGLVEIGAVMLTQRDSAENRTMSGGASRTGTTRTSV